MSYKDPKGIPEKNAPFVCHACLKKMAPRPADGWPIVAKWASAAKGRGVFALRDIPKGETVVRCWVMPIPVAESKITLTIPTINRYLFPWTDGQRAMLSGEGLLYNFDSIVATKRPPNMECVLRRGISAVEFRALRDIRMNEELTWDYKRAVVRRT
ncbi:MAG: SET domain-containing protein-lysine N-methyltransferase [Gemmatimonadales bacterium]|nr:MAG: SET domain-containing protein-lysine N-methyltransferase [Gemmatimonadales bacterium]